MAVRQKLHLVRRNHTFEERIAEMVNCTVNPPEVDIFGWKMKKKIFCPYTMLKHYEKNKKKKEKKD